MNADEICSTIQRAVSDYMRRTPAHLRDCDVMTGDIVRYLRTVIPAASTGVELPNEPTPAIINAMERTFFGESAVEITGPTDPVAKRQWAIWAEVYRAILEAARAHV